MREPLYIAVDFDGTCVVHAYPEIGRDVGAVPVLKALVNNGHRLILNTMRSGVYLERAKAWFASHGIALYGANRNPDQDSWTQSPKVYAHLYIDDAALGAPLVSGIDGERDYIDWDAVSRYLQNAGVL